MTVAVLGGTYNPVHIGHLVLGQDVAEQFGADLVLFVPASVPAHKGRPESEPGGATADDRLAMLRAALEGVPGLAADDCELARGGVSYTVDTIADVVRRYPVTGRPILVIGDDLLAGFPAWREPDAVAARARVVVAHRRTTEELPFPYPHEYCANTLIAVSSTSIRERVRAGRSIRFLVPEPVRRYIEARGLYR